MNIDDYPQEFFEEYIDNLFQQQRKNLDKTVIEFLEENGYEVPKVITNDYLNNLKNELAKEDKFIDTIEWTDWSIKNNSVIQHIILFFNKISCPLTEKDKQKLIKIQQRNNSIK